LRRAVLLLSAVRLLARLRLAVRVLRLLAVLLPYCCGSCGVAVLPRLSLRCAVRLRLAVRVLTILVLLPVRDLILRPGVLAGLLRSAVGLLTRLTRLTELARLLLLAVLAWLLPRKAAGPADRTGPAVLPAVLAGLLRLRRTAADLPDRIGRLLRLARLLPAVLRRAIRLLLAELSRLLGCTVRLLRLRSIRLLLSRLRLAIGRRCCGLPVLRLPPYGCCPAPGCPNCPGCPAAAPYGCCP
jgi:hypothetical protein